MALQLKDRVLETASAPGTGTVTLLGASLGYQSFNTALTSGSTTYYAIADLGGANWEVGVGTFTSPDQLVRNTVLESSGGGSTVNTFASGEIYIPNYRSSNQKLFSVDLVQENNGTDAYADIQAGLWNQTAAITAMTLASGSGLYLAKSTFTLYGVL
jgi:hypothetical protein